jgi:large subunit ribosomal protein L28
MSKVCQLTGKMKSSGCNVSHSNRHTKRTFDPNVSKKTIVDPNTGKKVKIRISASAQKTLLKNPGKFKAVLGSIIKKQQKRVKK